MKKLLTLLCCYHLGFASACGHTQNPATRDDAENLKLRAQTLERKKIERVEAAVNSDESPTHCGDTGEVPENIVKIARSELVKRLGNVKIQIHCMQSIMWNSGALGCPRTGEVYPQVPVEGYQVVLIAGGKTWDYRMSKSGGLVLCENPIKLQR